MASIAHLAAGAACGAAYARVTGSDPRKCVPAMALLALAPDLDFLAYAVGLEDTPLEHRVVTHSIFGSACVGLLAWVVARGRPHARALALWCTVAFLSHGVLDAATDNRPGPQLFWPFGDTVRFPWRPVPGAENFRIYFGLEAIPILAVELLWCVPLLLLAAWLSRSAMKAGGPA